MAASTPIWLRHDASLEHRMPGFPGLRERPERIGALEAAMERRDWLGWRHVEAPRAQRAQLLAVHAEAHVRRIEELSRRGGGWIDPDTYAASQTWEAALRAAGGAVAMVDALLSDGASAGMAALRPPGHHAEPARAMGFCFFDNVAVAARHALDAHGLERVLILDWDVHHGNGTNEAFHDSAAVLFASIHQSPLYPGTGPARDVGSGEGLGRTVNLPVPPGSGDAEFTSLVEHVVVPIARAYRPQLVLVSAGFDAHALEPLPDCECECSEDGYVTMTRSLRALSDELDAPLGMVLEGGYSTEALARSVVALLPTLAGERRDAPAPTIACDPLAVAARERLARFWPVLSEA